MLKLLFAPCPGVGDVLPWAVVDAVPAEDALGVVETPVPDLALDVEALATDPAAGPAARAAVPLLYGTKGTKSWILVFSLLHMVGVYLFIGAQGTVATYGIMAGLLVLLGANMLIQRGKKPADWMKALPLFHVTMLVYVVSIIADYFV